MMKKKRDQDSKKRTDESTPQRRCRKRLDLRHIQAKTSDVGVRIVWDHAPERVGIEIYNDGQIKPAGKTRGDEFEFSGDTVGALTVNIINANIEIGAYATVISVRAQERSFSFFLRDALDSRNPIFIPEYSVAVTKAGDRRSYKRIAADVAAKKLIGDFERFERQPEENWENTSPKNCSSHCPTWLGLSRDCRFFFLNPPSPAGGSWGSLDVCENGNHPRASFSFCLGQGSACSVNITRTLDDRHLPVLRSVQKEDRVEYRLCAFASLLDGPLNAVPVMGSDYRCCAPSGLGTPTDSFATDAEKLDLIKKETVEREDKVICVIGVEAVNTSDVPSYAWFKTPFPSSPKHRAESGGDYADGFSLDKQGAVFAANRLNGMPMPQAEAAALIPPGESVMFEMVFSHSPTPLEQAQALMEVDVQDHLRGAREYWRKKLDVAGKITVPEHPLNNIIKANLLNLELATVGSEPDGPLAAKVGGYPPIGTEIPPIIQYFDSVGMYDVAERAIDFFLVRQWPNGFIQTYNSHMMAETGPVLWTMGEHFRYTGDRKWLKRVTPNIIRACEQQLRWRDENKTDECREKGCYGLISGSLGDDYHPFHWFYLNSGCYIGLKRSVEMLRHTAPDFANELDKESRAFKDDIRAALFESAAKAMVAPCGDGSWAPWIPFWAETRGMPSLYADGGNWRSHGTFFYGWLTGPLSLIFDEVINPDEPIVDLMLKANQYPMTTENAALTQPYYLRHDYVHLRRGDVKPFLKAYYNQLTGLVDRETFAFWEHYCHNRPGGVNKTHSAGWFLMQTRWMLYVEEEDCLNMLSMAPRRWFEHGKTIEIDGMRCYFGKISLKVVSKIKKGKIVCDMVFHDKDRLPSKLKIRIPHPDGKKAMASSAGCYDAATETVIFDPCRDRQQWEVVV